jgi:hypothetical protein
MFKGKDQAISNVYKAFNELFSIRPVLTPREAREILKGFRQDIDVMLHNIDAMELSGIPLDHRPEPQ